MMECIVQTYFVSNGYFYITALLLFGHYFVISQYMYSDIFSSFFVNKSKRFGQSKFAIDWPICIMIGTGARLACSDN